MTLWEMVVYGTKIAAIVAGVAVIVGVAGAIYARGGKTPVDAPKDEQE